MKFLLLIFCFQLSALGMDGLASWYVPNSEFGVRSSEFVCASWFYPVGTRLRVTELHNGLHVDVRVIERGPARRFIMGTATRHPSRIIDLCPAAFAQLDGLELGLAEVRIVAVGPEHSTFNVQHPTSK